MTQLVILRNGMTAEINPVKVKCGEWTTAGQSIDFNGNRSYELWRNDGTWAATKGELSPMDIDYERTHSI